MAAGLRADSWPSSGSTVSRTARLSSCSAKLTVPPETPVERLQHRLPDVRVRIGDADADEEREHVAHHGARRAVERRDGVRGREQRAAAQRRLAPERRRGRAQQRRHVRHDEAQRGKLLPLITTRCARRERLQREQRRGLGCGLHGRALAALRGGISHNLSKELSQQVGRREVRGRRRLGLGQGLVISRQMHISRGGARPRHPRELLREQVEQPPLALLGHRRHVRAQLAQRVRELGRELQREHRGQQRGEVRPQLRARHRRERAEAQQRLGAVKLRLGALAQRLAQRRQQPRQHHALQVRPQPLTPQPLKHGRLCGEGRAAQRRGRARVRRARRLREQPQALGELRLGELVGARARELGQQPQRRMAQLGVSPVREVAGGRLARHAEARGDEVVRGGGRGVRGRGAAREQRLQRQQRAVPRVRAVVARQRGARAREQLVKPLHLLPRDARRHEAQARAQRRARRGAQVRARRAEHMPQQVEGERDVRVHDRRSVLGQRAQHQRGAQRAHLARGALAARAAAAALTARRRLLVAQHRATCTREVAERVAGEVQRLHRVRLVRERRAQVLGEARQPRPVAANARGVLRLHLHQRVDSDHSAGQMVGLGRGEQLLQAAEGLRQEALHLLRRHLLRVRLEEVVQRERRRMLVFEAVASQAGHQPTGVGGLALIEGGDGTEHHRGRRVTPAQGEDGRGHDTRRKPFAQRAAKFSRRRGASGGPKPAQPPRTLHRG
eukprot:scaffold51500_cov64-Phaeocystis_antarctica.AAC.3